MSLRNKLRTWLGVDALTVEVNIAQRQIELVSDACAKHRAEKQAATGGKITEDLVRAEYSPDQTGNVITAEPKILLRYRS